MQIQLPSMADVHRALDLWSAADERLGRLIARYGDPAPALRHYGLVLWEGGALQSASQSLIAAAALKPDDSKVWNDLASVFNALGLGKEAAACASESLTHDVHQPGVWQQLGMIRAALGETQASVEAYRRAVEQAPNLVEAWVGLGLAYGAAKNPHAAILPLREAIRLGKAGDPVIQSCLAQALDSIGDFAGAATTFAIVCRLRPDDHALMMQHARMQFAIDVLDGTVVDAIIACEARGLTKADVDKTAHDAFHILSAYEHRRAAIEVGAWRLTRDPSDAIQAYLLATLKGESMARAPDTYIVDFFDKFADEFEKKLVEILEYKVPGDLTTLTLGAADRLGLPVDSVLDIGCGTGLAGARLARPGRSLTGVDLSPRMLDKARALGCYHDLHEAELATFLARDMTVYDLVMAADVLIYFGDLSPVMRGVARRLETGGLFAFSIESPKEQKDILHLSSGRFAHHPAYVEREATLAGFSILEMVPTDIRRDVQGPARGALFVLRKS